MEIVVFETGLIVLVSIDLGIDDLYLKGIRGFEDLSEIFRVCPEQVFQQGIGPDMRLCGLPKSCKLIDQNSKRNQEYR